MKIYKIFDIDENDNEINTHWVCEKCMAFFTTEFNYQVSMSKNFDSNFQNFICNGCIIRKKIH